MWTRWQMLCSCHNIRKFNMQNVVSLNSVYCFYLSIYSMIFKYLLHKVSFLWNQQNSHLHILHRYNLKGYIDQILWRIEKNKSFISSISCHVALKRKYNKTLNIPSGYRTWNEIIIPYSKVVSTLSIFDSQWT